MPKFYVTKNIYGREIGPLEGKNKRDVVDKMMDTFQRWAEEEHKGAVVHEICIEEVIDGDVYYMRDELLKSLVTQDEFRTMVEEKKHRRLNSQNRS